MKISINDVLEQANPEQGAEFFKEHMQQVARSALFSLIEDEVRLLCGTKHKPEPTSLFKRAGTALSSLLIFGHKEPFKKPRVRTNDGEEVKLETVKLAQDKTAWEDSMMR